MVAIGGNLTTGNNVNLKGKTNTAIINANTTSSTINIFSPNSTDTTYTVSKSSALSKVLSLGNNNNGNVNILVSGYATNGDDLAITLFNSNFPGGEVQIGYTVISDSEPLTDMATGLINAININLAIILR